MLLHRLVQLCWCTLALCLWIFVDIIRLNVVGQGTNSENIEKVGGFCGTVSTKINLPSAQQEIYTEGKITFKNYCASCHNKNMKDNMTGPALLGAEERWAAYPREDLYNWIRNSQKLIDEKHPRAVKLYKEWNLSVMTSFPNMTDEEIEGVLLYITNNAR